MGLRYEDLTPHTRRLMCEEIASDTADKNIYLSNYLSEEGCQTWPRLLYDAADQGTDETLANEINRRACFKEKTERRKPNGGTTLARVPSTAAQTLSESQFNMYYMRSLARQALETGQSLIVYRAKSVAVPRPESEAMIGISLDPNEVLNELRKTHGVEPSINIPMPNTGITVALKKR